MEVQKITGLVFTVDHIQFTTFAKANNSQKVNVFQRKFRSVHSILMAR